MPRNQPAMVGDLGIRAEWASEPSTTISAVAATITNANSAASAGVSHCGRARGMLTAPPGRGAPPSAATLTKTRDSQRRPDALRLEVGGQAVVTVLATDAGGLEAAERNRRVGQSPG